MIRDANAARFWCEVYIAQTTSQEPILMDDCEETMPVTQAADGALEDYAERFGSEDLLSDIENWKQRRASGNEPE